MDDKNMEFEFGTADNRGASENKAFKVLMYKISVFSIFNT